MLLSTLNHHLFACCCFISGFRTLRRTRLFECSAVVRYAVPNLSDSEAYLCFTLYAALSCCNNLPFTAPCSLQFIFLADLYTHRFPCSSWSCQCPCGCGTVVKRYIIMYRLDHSKTKTDSSCITKRSGSNDPICTFFYFEFESPVCCRMHGQFSRQRNRVSKYALSPLNHT